MGVYDGRVETAWVFIRPRYSFAHGESCQCAEPVQGRADSNRREAPPSCRGHNCLVNPNRQAWHNENSWRPKKSTPPGEQWRPKKSEASRTSRQQRAHPAGANCDRNLRSYRIACSLLCIVFILEFQRNLESHTYCFKSFKLIPDSCFVLSGTHQWYLCLSLRLFCICLDLVSRFLAANVYKDDSKL